MKKKILHFDLDGLETYRVRQVGEYTGKTFQEKVSQMANDILVEKNYFINEFNGEYLGEINNLIKKGITAETIISIEDKVSIYLNKYFKINNFHFGINHFKQLTDLNKYNFILYFEENFLKEFYSFLLNIDNFIIPSISPDSKEGGIFNGTLFGYLKNGKIHFKFEYETSEEIRNKSFEDSEINLLIEEFLDNQKNSY